MTQLYRLLAAYLFCPIDFIPGPGSGLWFGFLHFTINHHKVPQIADYRLVSHLTDLWSWRKTTEMMMLMKT